jgi:sulfate adenylyltransferase
MADLIAPHGGTLLTRLAPPEVREELREAAKGLKQKTLNLREQGDLELIAIGGYSPLAGFMGKRDYDSVVHSMHLSNGLAWSVPITLSATKEEAKGFREGDDIALVTEQGDTIALLHLQELFTYDKATEGKEVFRTADIQHPGVKNLFLQGEVLLGGPVTVLERTTNPTFARYDLPPAETRRIIAERGWRTVVGFQTRNPVHRAHEYVQKCALETIDGLLLHPLVGETKNDDIPAEIRMRCYEALLESYYPKDRVLLAILPAPMRYAGPREAIHHALVRKNYGCTHFIVGRDHAGVGSYYGTYDAQRIFSEFTPGELGIQPMFFENTFYCKRCGGMASQKTCPHSEQSHVSLSGTKVRAMLQNGEPLPPEFTRPEVAEVLREAFTTVKASR